MTRFHGIVLPRSEDAAGWRDLADGALAWLVYAPSSEPIAEVWLRGLPTPWPEEPGALLEHFGAAARGLRIATGAAAVWSGESIHVAWAGDVRALLVRGGQPVASTADHTLARKLGRSDDRLGRITDRYLGDGAAPERAQWDTRPGDVLLLCAPHVHDFRPEEAWLTRALQPVVTLPGRLILRADGPVESMALPEGTRYETLNTQRRKLAAVITRSSLSLLHKKSLIESAFHYTQWNDMKSGVIAQLVESMGSARSGRRVREFMRIIAEIRQLP